MPKTSQRIRIFDFPFASLLFDAYLESVREEQSGAALDIVLDFYAFEATGPSRHYVIGSQPYEQVNGLYRPCRLRFTQAQWITRTGVFADLATFAETPADHEARRLMGALHAYTPTDGEFFYVSNASPEFMLFSLRAASYRLEERDEPSIPAQYLRRWAFTPPTPAGLLPHRPALYRRFAGDPVTIRLGKRAYRRRLFIGGVVMQGPERPVVDHVLNLCSEPNPWLTQGTPYPSDRFACKGEMALGMRLDDLREEAEWVVERLRAGRSILVHCYAGINRSATVCCAALILMEGLTAEQALARVRESRPGAQPDPYHWFLLLRLAEQQHGEQFALFPSAMESLAREDTHADTIPTIAAQNAHQIPAADDGATLADPEPDSALAG